MTYLRRLALGLVFLTPTTLLAQNGVSLGGFAVATADTRDLRMLMGGLSAKLDKPGLTPVVGIQAFRLTYGPNDTDRVTGYKPSVGLEYNRETSSMGAQIGYQFLNQPALTFVPGSPAGSDNGLTVGGHYSAWDGVLSRTIALDYNTKSQYIWTGAHASRVIASRSNHEIAAGLEASFQGQKSAYQLSAGPRLSVQWSPGFSTTISAGPKFYLSTKESPALYGKISVGF